MTSVGHQEDAVTQPPATTQPADSERSPGGIRINEDWAATAIGIVLVLLVLAGVIVKAMVP
jgi:hypothetical protein